MHFEDIFFKMNFSGYIADLCIKYFSQKKMILKNDFTPKFGFYIGIYILKLKKTDFSEQCETLHSNLKR